jgi:hypothetical protein
LTITQSGRRGICGALVGAVCLAAPRVALACPVCFGQNDSPLASAMNLGIVAMLVVVAGVLAAFGSFIVYLNRRANLAELSAGAQRAGHAPVASSPQEI